MTTIGYVVVAAAQPWPLKILVDSVLGGRPVPHWFAVLIPSTAGASPVTLLVIVVVAGLLVQIAHELVRMIDTQLQVDTGQRIVYTLRAKLLEHLQALPLRHHILTRTADSVYRLDADAHCVNDLAIGGVFPLALAVVNLVVMFVILVYLDLTLGLLSLTVVPFLYLCLRYYSRTMIDRAERVKELESTLIDRAFEILSSVELAQFSRSGDEAMHVRLRLTWQESLFSVAVTAITLAGTALVLIVGGLHVLDSTLTVGSLLVVIAYLAAVYNPMSAIAHTTGSLQQAAVSARRVREVFALTPERLDGPDTLDASEVEGRVRFESVGFSYDDDRRVLEDVSFEVRPGEMFAIVGVTGAGKTTIANLIPRFFEPKSGRVLVDEVDVRRYSLRSLRERIAVVPQQPVLFSGTIADNIRYGRLEASDQEIEAAARAAYVHEFIQQLPQGYQTPVAEAGATLSGGERQRLGLARALLKNAPILLLDEPTSSLDALSEAAVFGALRRLRKGRTTIVIAHRLSTIRDATRILVLHEGWLIDQGTHDELMASNDLYRRMCARLSVGRSLDEPETFDELMQVIP